MLLYLQAFADRFHLQELVHLSTEVVRAVPVQASTAAHQQAGSVAASTQQQPHQQQPAAPNPPVPWQRWQVTWRGLGACGIHTNSSTAAVRAAAAGGAACVADGPAPASAEHTELFDALLVCNGHYTEPNVPDIPGASEFPGLLMHSHNYRRADRFKGQHVAVIGPSYSGALSRDNTASLTAGLVPSACVMGWPPAEAGGALLQTLLPAPVCFTKPLDKALLLQSRGTRLLTADTLLRRAACRPGHCAAGVSGGSAGVPLCPGVAHP